MSVPSRIAIAVFALYAALTCGFDVSEGRDDAALARHVLHAGSLAMDAPLNPNWVRGVDGRYYSAHEAGNALALIPAVYAADRIGGAVAPTLGVDRAHLVAGALLPLVAAAYVALTVMAFAVILMEVFRLRARLTIALTLALGLTTILAPYSRMLFDGVLAGMLIACSLACATVATARESRGAAFTAGLLSAAAFATRQPVILLTAATIGHLLFDARPTRGRTLVILFMAGLVPGLLWQGWYNDVRTGSPFFPAVALPQFDNVNGRGDVIDGLTGLLFSPGKSMFLYSPLLLLAPFGWNRLRTLCPGLAWGLLAGAIAYLLLHAQVRNWSGDWGWGPRYTVPLTMPLMLPAALAIESALAGSLWRRRAVVALAVAGAGVQAVAFATNWHYYYAWLAEHGRFDRGTLAWSVSEGQLVAMVRVLVRNVARMSGAPVDPFVVSGASSLSAVTGNGLNVWPATAIAAGMPVWFVTVAATAAIACAALALRWVLRARVVSLPS